MRKDEQIVEFDKIKKILEEYAKVDENKERFKQLEPSLYESEVNYALRQTSEARFMIDKFGQPPFTDFSKIKEYIPLAVKGVALTPEQLTGIASEITVLSRIKSYLERGKVYNNGLAFYADNLIELNELADEIKRLIRNDKVDDYATKKLKDIRGKLEKLDNSLKDKANSILRQHKKYMADSFYTNKNGHICVPVKCEYKNHIDGSVIERSSTGATLYIEPTAVRKIEEEIEALRIEEDCEVLTILYTLAAMVAESEEAFNANYEVLVKLDYAFAKGMLSCTQQAIAPEIITDRRIVLKRARHPLMDKDTFVPLDFSIGENGITGVIITGPNTGGKTVAIKTVAINCYMAACGLHVPCEEAQICINSNILCDIGDGQNIFENLSTFSSHIKNVLEILKLCSRESLVIMDELGSGTDPTEGMGIAIAVLEELKKSGALFFITTHYPEVKNYAEKTNGIMNARMTFDKESLKPTYHLEIGKAGESCAFYIAKKLGMPGKMLARAQAAAYEDNNKGNIALKPALTIDYDSNEELKREFTPNVHKTKYVSKNQTHAESFNIGDSVMVFPSKKIGIVCEKADIKGVLRVQMPNKKIYINHTRVKLKVAADRLYPEDYDFSIVFDTAENRKKRHDMERKYTNEVVVIEEK